MTDADAWILHPQLRRYFNKLELALMLGHAAGPSGVRVPFAGEYVVRPIYNLLGMGVGATVEYLTPDSKDIPPGYFWCEKFQGRHISVDFFLHDDGRLVPTLVVEGFHQPDSPLYKFRRWERLDTSAVDPLLINNELITAVRSVSDETTYVGPINVEFVGDHIIELHFRNNPDFQNDETSLIVVWNGTGPAAIGREFVASEDDAGGYLPETRTGFLVKR